MSCHHGYNKKYHMTADPMMEELILQIRDKEASIKSHISCINKHFKRFSVEDQGNAKFLGLNALYCHYGDKFKKETKDRDMQKFIKSTEILKCLSDIRKNKLESAKTHLDEEKKEFCESGSCERTAFYHKASASWCLQNAWTTTGQVKEKYKKHAREGFQKCKDYFQQLSQDNPNCKYLRALYLIASTNTIFLRMKLCWFLFDPQSMINRFENHRCEMADIKKAGELIETAMEESMGIEAGSPFNHLVQYKILLVRMFHQCRLIQCAEQKHEKEDAIICAQNVLEQLKSNYQNKFNCMDCDIFSELLEHLKEQVNSVHISAWQPFSEESSTHTGATTNQEQLSDLTGLSSDQVDGSQSDNL